MALRGNGLARRIVSVSRRPMDEAIEFGLVDAATDDLAAASREADLIVLCTPVEVIREQLPTVLRAARAGTLVTDVGSTKLRLVEFAESLEGGANFVGSHPMAGSHLTGWRAGSPTLFRGAVCHVTATECTDLAAVARVGALWRAVGARVVHLHPRRHDYLCALVSHLPHMTAVSLSETIRRSREDPALLRVVAGNGLRDTTRVAMGSGAVWSEIAAHNGENIANLLDQVAATATGLAERIRGGGEGLEEFLETVRRFRTELQQ